MPLDPGLIPDQSFIAQWYSTVGHYFGWRRSPQKQRSKGKDKDKDILYVGFRRGARRLHHSYL